MAKAKSYTGFGEVHGLREWARLLDVNKDTLGYNLSKGKTIEEFAAERGIKYTAQLEKTATRIEARHRIYEGFGEKHTSAQWAKLLGLPRNSLWRYLKKGLSIEEVARIRHAGNPTT